VVLVAVARLFTSAEVNVLLFCVQVGVVGAAETRPGAMPPAPRAQTPVNASAASARVVDLMTSLSVTDVERPSLSRPSGPIVPPFPGTFGPEATIAQPRPGGNMAFDVSTALAATPFGYAGRSWECCAWSAISRPRDASSFCSSLRADWSKTFLE
jgi:hypothetical protein